MRFSLKNAAAFFQRVMDIIVSSIIWPFALVHVDDIVSFLQTPRENINHTQPVLRLPKKAKHTLKLKNCAFFTNEIDYLGRVIRPGRP